MLLTGACGGVSVSEGVDGRIPLSLPVRAPSGGLAPETGPVELKYLGVGGWILRTPRSTLLTGTLMTRPSLLDVGFGASLAPDAVEIARGLEHVGASSLDETVAILVGHGHYDHALDVPWLMVGPTPRARVLTNRTTRLQLLTFAEEFGFDPDRIEDVGPLAGDQEAPGTWIRVAPDLRVLPLMGDHAPHVEGKTLYSGVRRRSLPEEPGPATEWLDGASLSFLVDVLNPDGSVGLRVYYHDAIPREPAGWMPPPEVRGDSIPVDIALLVPASFAGVRWHPESLIQNLRPAVVIAEHWEDFFIPVTDPVRPLRFSDVGEFLTRARRAMGCDDCVYLPLQGTRFLVPPRDRGGTGHLTRTPVAGASGGG
jgi:hypothetical protein